MCIEPKFHYEQKVRIIGGFYRGMKGKILDISAGGNAGVEYMVEIWSNPFIPASMVRWIYSEHLKAR